MLRYQDFSFVGMTNWQNLPAMTQVFISGCRLYKKFKSMFDWCRRADLQV